jgi:hypothetical protein
LPDRSGPAEGLSRDDLDVTYDSEANNTSLFYRGLSPHGGNAGECRSYIGRLCKLSYLDGIETLDGLLRYDTNEIYSGRPKRALKSEDPFLERRRPEMTGRVRGRQLVTCLPLSGTAWQALRKLKQNVKPCFSTKYK